LVLHAATNFTARLAAATKFDDQPPAAPGIQPSASASFFQELATVKASPIGLQKKGHNTMAMPLKLRDTNALELKLAA